MKQAFKNLSGKKRRPEERERESGREGRGMEGSVWVWVGGGGGEKAALVWEGGKDRNHSSNEQWFSCFSAVVGTRKLIWNLGTQVSFPL